MYDSRIRLIHDYIKRGNSLRYALNGQADTIINIVDKITQTFRNNGKVVLFGNGGSAADAQHIAAEFTGRFYHERKPLPSIALTTNTSCITAISNDYGYEQVFVRQIQSLVCSGDVVIGISTSGASQNVILAMKEAKLKGAITVAFTGADGKLNEISDFVVSIPSKDTPCIQETHIMVGHIICYLVEQALVEEPKAYE
jgi:D-sedoheptulose 7-phosphate isomerase